MSQTEVECPRQAGAATENPGESLLQPGEARGKAMGAAKHLLHREVSFRTLRGLAAKSLD